MANLVRNGESRAEADVFINAATPLRLAHSSHRCQAWTHTCTHTHQENIQTALNTLKTVNTSPVHCTVLLVSFLFFFNLEKQKENCSGRWEMFVEHAGFYTLQAAKPTQCKNNSRQASGCPPVDVFFISDWKKKVEGQARANIETCGEGCSKFKSSPQSRCRSSFFSLRLLLP